MKWFLHLFENYWKFVKSSATWQSTIVPNYEYQLTALQSRVSRLQIYDVARGCGGSTAVVTGSRADTRLHQVHGLRRHPEAPP